MPRKRYYAKVMNGNLDKTPGGLKKKDIKVVYKGGEKRYVSKKKSEQAKKTFANWNKAVSQAKKELGYDKNEFVKIKGDLLDKAREIYYENK